MIDNNLNIVGVFNIVLFGKRSHQRGQINFVLFILFKDIKKSSKAWFIQKRFVSLNINNNIRIVIKNCFCNSITTTFMFFLASKNKTSKFFNFTLNSITISSNNYLRKKAGSNYILIRMGNYCSIP